MLARVLSAALVGVEAALVRVEVDVASGLPAFTTVGLPDSAVRESRERVRTAIRNAGFPFPSDRITVNLAPADLRKDPVDIGVIAVPAESAQHVIDTLVAAGVRAILSYAPVTVQVPAGVEVRRLDPLVSLQSMTYYLRRDR